MNTPREISPKDLMREKSLFAIYRLSFKFPTSKFNTAVTAAAAIALILASFFNRSQVEALALNLRTLLAFGNSAVPSILGFLIAGFTIFVTVTKSEIFVYMAKRPYKETGESFLKYNLAAFVLAFTHYLAYLFAVVLFVLFAQPGSPLIGGVKAVLSGLCVRETPAYNILLGALLVGLGTWTVYLVLLLKSFVYNTYQVVTTAVRWEMTQEDLRNKKMQVVSLEGVVTETDTDTIQKQTEQQEAK